MLVGGLNTTKLFTSMKKKINSIKKEALNLGFINAKEWEEIAESLIKD
jgi:ribosomal protein L7/L12